MRINPNRSWIAVLAFLTIVVLAGVAVGQQPKSLVATANGEGSIKFGKEEFKIYSVVIKCFEDGKAEISLVTDITVFVNGNWSRTDDMSNEIALKITGGSVSGNLDGGGKLLLTADRKSITGLNLQVVNRTTKKVIKADFVAK
jgi:hypothetical protein